MDGCIHRTDLDDLCAELGDEAAIGGAAGRGFRGGQAGDVADRVGGRVLLNDIRTFRLRSLWITWSGRIYTNDMRNYKSMI